MTLILAFLSENEYLCVLFKTNVIMKLKAYSKSELAQAYAPEISPRSALNRLQAWIKYNRELHDTLLCEGYKPHQKIFTVRQVQLIFHYLGEP